jgi:hypothetical protein
MKLTITMTVESPRVGELLRLIAAVIKWRQREKHYLPAPTIALTGTGQVE